VRHSVAPLNKPSIVLALVLVLETTQARWSTRRSRTWLPLKPGNSQRNRHLTPEALGGSSPGQVQERVIDVDANDHNLAEARLSLVVAMIHATPAPTARNTSAQASGLGGQGYRTLRPEGPGWPAPSPFVMVRIAEVKNPMLKNQMTGQNVIDAPGL